MSDSAAKELLYNAVSVAAAGIPVALPNKDFEPPSNSDSKYYDAKVLPAQKIGLGIPFSSSDRQDGILQVLSYVRDDQGEYPADILAEQIITAFPKGTKLTDGTITVQIDSPPYKSP